MVAMQRQPKFATIVNPLGAGHPVITFGIG
jgi:hypothetical protein